MTDGVAEMPTTSADAERLQRLAGVSREHESVLIEMVFQDRWVRLEIDVLQYRHLPMATLWERFFEPAFRALTVPDPVRADPEPG